MWKRRDDWADVFDGLTKSFVGVLRAEVDVLRELWSRRVLKRGAAALALLLPAAWFSMALIVLLILAAVQMVEHFTALEPWQATLTVAAGVLAIVIALASVSYHVFVRRFENPIVIAQGRLRNHVEWWRESLLSDARTLPEGEIDGDR